jgi:hypothetical protein
MIRFTALTLLVACGAAAQPQRTAAPANQLAITRYELPATRMPDMEGRHSSQHHTTMLTGSLEVIGTGDATTARLTLDSTTQTSYVLCPDGKPWKGDTRQACHAEAPPDAGQPVRSILVLTGPAAWQGGALRVTVSKELQPRPDRAPYTIRLVLACTPVGTGLDCAVEDREQMGMWGQSSVHFERAQHPALAPRLARQSL